MEFKSALSDTVFGSFSVIPDLRAQNKTHPLETILFVVIVGLLCGADGFVQIERIARLKEDFLRRYIDLSSGVPTHDTLTRVFQALDPKEFLKAFVKFIAAVTHRPEQEIIHIDGKTLRGVPNKHSEQQAQAEDQAHIVSAFSEQRRVVLAQIRSAAVANELEAARQLLEILDIRGAIITADCAHCQTETFERIQERGGDAVIGVKDNQPTIRKQIEEKFKTTNEQPLAVNSIEKGHGRLETRCYEVLEASDVPSLKERFPSVQSIVRVTRLREVLHGKTSQEIHFYLSTLVKEKAQLSADCIRAHWSIENSLHFVLDMAFDEDHCRVRVKNAPENLSRVRHIVLSLLHQEKREKHGLKTKRMIALGDDQFLADVLRLPSRIE